MLSRRNVRVKVMQVLYAQNRDEGLDQKSTVKEYWKKIDDSFDLLLFSVNNIIRITKPQLMIMRKENPNIFRVIWIKFSHQNFGPIA
ncbi:MAG: hypothetical protein IPO48_03040 [Saprospiraceae bacterium]|nr:hypothetical protein [Saprospiraceae bacterium]